MLLTDGIKACDWAEGAIVFDATGDLLGEIVTEFEVGRENQALVHARPVKGTVERRIERKIPAAHLFINDGANFPGPSVRGIPAALPANFIGKANANWPMPFRGNAHARTDVASNVIPTLAILNVGEDIEAGFEPVTEAMTDLDGFVELVIGGQCAVVSRLGALKSEIGMELEHGVAGLHGLVRIHLDFVVPLSP